MIARAAAAALVLNALACSGGEPLDGASLAEGTPEGGEGGHLEPPPANEGGAAPSSGADASLTSTATGTGTGGAGAATSGGGTGEQLPCDSGLAFDSSDARDAARAIGICADASTDGYGLVDAEYVTSGGKPLAGFDPKGLGHGLLGKFGKLVKPREGARMLALSSGAARNPWQAGYRAPKGFDKNYGSAAPPGYPKESPSCKGVQSGKPRDSAGLRVKLRVPEGAKSLSFRSNFYTYEFPDYVCDEFNDFFVAMLTPRVGAVADDNIAFDSKGNTISVNAGFLRVCHPQTAGGKTFKCPLGPGALGGTGFDLQKNGSAATGWLVTKAPVDAEEITLFFAIWDSGDGSLDSTVLIDGFRWDSVPADTVTEPEPYQPK